MALATKPKTTNTTNTASNTLISAAELDQLKKKVASTETALELQQQQYAELIDAFRAEQAKCEELQQQLAHEEVLSESASIEPVLPQEVKAEIIRALPNAEQYAKFLQFARPILDGAAPYTRELYDALLHKDAKLFETLWAQQSPSRAWLKQMRPQM